MKKFALLVTVIVFFGCKKQVSKEDLKNLTGYWEIERVNFPNGDTKEFTVNPTIDYIEVKDSSGFRKKVYPKFDGTFETSDDAETFIIEKLNGKFELRYRPGITLDTRMFSKIETLVHLSNNQFSVVNSDTITYTYKRFQPIKAAD